MNRLRISGIMFLVILIAGCNIQVGTAVRLPIGQVVQNCISIQSASPSNFITGGTILLGDFSERMLIGNLLAFKKSDETPVQLPDVPIYWGGKVSPDGNWFAYETVNEDAEFTSELIILDADGTKQFAFPWDKKWREFYWIDDQRVELVYGDDWQSTPPRSDIVNFFTGQRETLIPKLLNPWIPGGPSVIGLVQWKAVYDPTLTLVGYMRGEEPEQSFVLFDLKNNRDLWELNKWSVRTIRPVWSPDGKLLAVVALNQKEDNWDRFELYLINRDGQAEKWIDLKEYYSGSTIRQVIWSPDGRYLAFATVPEKPLLILDMINRRLLDYCISTNTEYSSIIWASDSSQVIVPRIGQPSIILDIEHNRAIYLDVGDKIRPVGWLNSKP